MKKAPKKKNDRTLFVAAVIVFALAVGLFVGSYARYYNSYSASGTMTTATWDFTVNGAAQDLSMNLLTAGTGVTVNNLVNGHIQPGSSGSYDITLAATNSEVAVYYSIEFGDITWSNNLSSPAPGFTWTVKKVESGSVTGSDVKAGATGTIQPGGNVVYRIEWEWAYGSNEDTTYNPYNNQTLTMSATIVGYQVNPNA